MLRSSAARNASASLVNGATDGSAGRTCSLNASAKILVLRVADLGKGGRRGNDQLPRRQHAATAVDEQAHGDWRIRQAFVPLSAGTIPTPVRARRPRSFVKSSTHTRRSSTRREGSSTTSHSMQPRSGRPGPSDGS